jgi:molybdopterin molybdotransferase
VSILTFREARDRVLSEVRTYRKPLAQERVPLEQASGRVVAVDVRADRDFPAVTRSVRDGFARQAGPAARLRVIGEVKAGEQFGAEVQAGEAVEIMTGAPIPGGCNAVVMVEHCTAHPDGSVDAPACQTGQFLSHQGEEARSGQVLLPSGTRLNFAHIGVLSAAGYAIVPVYPRLRVAIIATGDELCEIGSTPRPHQIRNSNAYALAAQVQRAGAEPEMLPIAPDQLEATYALVERGLKADLLLLSGGVSAGKYDFVEHALKQAGAEFYFDRVAIQPGQPLVFGKARGTFFFGLPGNPGSTMVTFELFARPALEFLSGVEQPVPPLPYGVLATDYRHKTGLTRFLPANLDSEGKLTPVPWHGSGDVPALGRANAWMVVDPDREAWCQGDTMPVILL